ncbi:hypothetical protein ACGFYV_05005 [Streptomyces sp. NPDC048297]|uniref:hypothetical protein n=1 Tax=Streptomyces sp. NPDC048297 TaxID=3365531 RepID=UPI003711B603
MTPDLDSLHAELYARLMPGLPPPFTLHALHALPATFALTGVKAEEREPLFGVLHGEIHPLTTRAGRTPISDRQYCGRAFHGRFHRRFHRHERVGPAGELHGDEADLATRPPTANRPTHQLLGALAGPGKEPHGFRAPCPRSGTDRT